MFGGFTIVILHLQRVLQPYPSFVTVIRTYSDDSVYLCQEYSEDSNSEPDVDLENQYYNSKALRADDPRGALTSFQKVLELEGQDKGEWGFRALKQMIKINFVLVRCCSELLMYYRYSQSPQVTLQNSCLFLQFYQLADLYSSQQLVFMLISCKPACHRPTWCTHALGGALHILAGIRTLQGEHCISQLVYAHSRVNIAYLTWYTHALGRAPHILRGIYTHTLGGALDILPVIHVLQGTYCIPYLVYTIHMLQGEYEEMMGRYKQLLTYIKSAVTRNYSEKSINSILDNISTSKQVCWHLEFV